MQQRSAVGVGPTGSAIRPMLRPLAQSLCSPRARAGLRLIADRPPMKCRRRWRSRRGEVEAPACERSIGRPVPAWVASELCRGRASR